MPPTSLLIGTHNSGKLREIKNILGEVGLEIKSLNDFPSVGVAEENEDSYAGNATAKALYYAAATGLMSLGDDSGLEVTALDGAPGLFSARYAGEKASDSDRRILLLDNLEKSSSKDRSARFVCAVAIAAPDQSVVKLAEGVCDGTIGFQSVGTGGFGYDPLFIPKGFSQTFAELPETQKSLISHRGRALAQIRDFLIRDNIQS